MEDRHPKKQVNTLGKQIRRSASNIFQKWRKEPKTSGRLWNFFLFVCIFFMTIMLYLSVEFVSEHVNWPVCQRRTSRGMCVFVGGGGGPGRVRF